MARDERGGVVGGAVGEAAAGERGGVDEREAGLVGLGERRRPLVARALGVDGVGQADHLAGQERRGGEALPGGARDPRQLAHGGAVAGGHVVERLAGPREVHEVGRDRRPVHRPRLGGDRGRAAALHAQPLPDGEVAAREAVQRAQRGDGGLVAERDAEEVLARLHHVHVLVALGRRHVFGLDHGLVGRRRRRGRALRRVVGDLDGRLGGDGPAGAQPEPLAGVDRVARDAVERHELRDGDAVLAGDGEERLALRHDVRLGPLRRRVGAEREGREKGQHGESEEPRYHASSSRSSSMRSACSSPRAWASPAAVACSTPRAMVPAASSGRSRRA